MFTSSTSERFLPHPPPRQLALIWDWGGTDLEGDIRYAADMIAESVFVGGWVGRDTNAGEEIYEIHD